MKKKYISFFIVLLSLIFIGNILYGNIDSLKSYTFKIDLLNITIGGLLLTTMLIITSFLHLLLLEDFVIIKTMRLEIMYSYLLSQIIKYIPGKFWGVLYQSERLKKNIPRSTTWFVNIFQGMITTINGVGILITIFISTYGIVYSIAFFITYSSMLYLLLDHKRFSILLRFIPKIISPKPKNDLLQHGVILKFILLEAEWLIYFMAWILITYNQMGIGNAVIIASIYASASILSWLIFLVPNGWVVREAIFIWLGSVIGFNENTLIMYGLLLRILLTLSEISAAFTFHIFYTADNKDG